MRCVVCTLPSDTGLGLCSGCLEAIPNLKLLKKALLTTDDDAAFKRRDYLRLTQGEALARRRHIHNESNKRRKRLKRDNGLPEV